MCFHDFFFFFLGRTKAGNLFGNFIVKQQIKLDNKYFDYYSELCMVSVHKFKRIHKHITFNKSTSLQHNIYYYKIYIVGKILENFLYLAHSYKKIHSKVQYCVSRFIMFKSLNRCNFFYK